jgi:hypothetical protein
MTQTLRRTLALTLFTVVASLASPGTAASGLTGRWVARAPNGDDTFR